MFKGQRLSTKSLKVGVKYKWKNDHREWTVLFTKELVNGTTEMVVTKDSTKNSNLVICQVRKDPALARIITYHPDDPVEFELQGVYEDPSGDLNIFEGTIKETGEKVFLNISSDDMALYDPDEVQDWRKNEQECE